MANQKGIIMKKFVYLVTFATLLYSFPLLAQTQNEVCPDLTEPLPALSGTFISYECADYCHLQVRLDYGLLVEFIADYQVQDAINTPDSIFKHGAKIIIAAEFMQFYETEYSGGECLSYNVAKTIASQQ
jgi:hypothetical protein